MSISLDLGKKGEALVVAHLEQAGFTIAKTNYTSRQGEIDIIAYKHDLIVFVEVKLRQNPQFSLSDLITPAKQRKIIKTALYYINQNQLLHKSDETMYRFDVAFVEGCHNYPQYTITYIENAFTASTHI